MSTQSVPPDAVFWAVTHVGTVSAAVDGVPLVRRGASGVERHQYVSAAPLAEGEHELVIQVEAPAVPPGERPDNGDERRIPFRVAAQAAPSASVSIDSVTVYPIDAASPETPPPGEYNVYCEEMAVPLEFSCNDFLPQYRSLIRFSVEGSAVASIVQGRILPTSCTQLSSYGDPDSPPSDFQAAVVLPSGLTVETEFAGPVKDASHDSAESEGCSLRVSPRPANALGALIGLAFVAGWARRRRRTDSGA